MNLTAILLTLKTLWKNKSIVLLSTLMVVLLSFFTYYHYSSARIKDLKERKTLLEHRLAQQEILMNDLKNNYKKIIKSRDELVEEIHSARKEIDDLQKVLSGKDRGKKTLEEIARKKTSLIESKVNVATENVIKCFELLSSGGDC